MTAYYYYTATLDGKISQGTVVASNWSDAFDLITDFGYKNITIYKTMETQCQ